MKRVRARYAPDGAFESLQARQPPAQSEPRYRVPSRVVKRSVVQDGESALR
jgi:hypothetical protein